jgi:hypothetical protein
MRDCPHSVLNLNGIEYGDQFFLLAQFSSPCRKDKNETNITSWPDWPAIHIKAKFDTLPPSTEPL